MLLLAVFVFQFATFVVAAPDTVTPHQDQTQTAHQVDCPMMAATLAGAVPEISCREHAVGAKCPNASCLFQIADCPATAVFESNLAAQDHFLKDGREASTRMSSPRDRPPRLV